MVPLMKEVSKKAGMPPGSLVYIGPDRTAPVMVDIVDYDEKELHEVHDASLDDAIQYRDRPTITWINVSGVHDVSVIDKLGQEYGIHPLVLEDIVNTSQRPKLEDHGDFLAMMIKMMRPGNGGNIIAEQVCLVVTGNKLLSFQELPDDAFDSVRDRLRRLVTRSRFMTTDYLAYSLLDSIADGYFAILETLGEQLEKLEEELTEEPKREHVKRLHTLKRELLMMRKRTWPLREAISNLLSTDSPLIHKETLLYWRDLHDHIMQIIDTIETFREMSSSLLDIYLSSVSNRMNEVIKVLTVIATIFIPLGFLASVYGMNFDPAASPFNMPELTMRYGYILFWVMAALICGGLLWLFRRKKWI